LRGKKQLIHRLPLDFIRSLLKDFNSGTLDAPSAAARLGVRSGRLRSSNFSRGEKVKKEKVVLGSAKSGW